MPFSRPHRAAVLSVGLLALAVAGCGSSAPAVSGLSGAQRSQLLADITHAREAALARRAGAARTALADFSAQVRSLQAQGALSSTTAADLLAEANAARSEAGSTTTTVLTTTADTLTTAPVNTVVPVTTAPAPAPTPGPTPPGQAKDHAKPPAPGHQKAHATPPAHHDHHPGHGHPAGPGGDAQQGGDD